MPICLSFSCNHISESSQHRDAIRKLSAEALTAGQLSFIVTLSSLARPDERDGITVISSSVHGSRALRNRFLLRLAPFATALILPCPRVTKHMILSDSPRSLPETTMAESLMAFMVSRYGRHGLAGAAPPWSVKGLPVAEVCS